MVAAVVVEGAELPEGRLYGRSVALLDAVAVEDRGDRRQRPAAALAPGRAFRELGHQPVEAARVGDHGLREVELPREQFCSVRGVHGDPAGGEQGLVVGPLDAVAEVDRNGEGAPLR